jgi:hypothetical protein
MGVRPGMGIKGALRDRALEENGNNGSTPQDWIGMRGKNGKINGWGIPLCAENKRSQQTKRYPWESMGAPSLCNSIHP